MKIKEKWVSWEEFNLLFPGLTSTYIIDFERIGGLIPGSIPFADTTGMLTEYNSAFFFDETNIRLGIGVDAPVCCGHFRGAVCPDYAGIHSDTILLLENDDNVILQMQAATDGEARIVFADDNFNPPAGRIMYNFAGDYMDFVIGTDVLVKFEKTGADSRIISSHRGIVIDSPSYAAFIADSHNADAYFELQEDSVLKWTVGFDFTDSLKFQICQDVIGTAIRFEIEPGVDGLINLYLDVGIRNSQDLRFYDNGNYVGFKPPPLGADQIWILPNADGGSANMAIITDSAGNLGWSQAIGTGDSPTFGGLAVTDYIYFDKNVEHVALFGFECGKNLAAGGTYNYFLGEQSGYSNTISDFSIAIGYQCIYRATTGGQNVALGYQALMGLDAGSTTYQQNVAVGYQAGQNIDAGATGNFLFGTQAGRNVGSGSYNFFFGTQAGYLNSGIGNVAIGLMAFRGLVLNAAAYNVNIGSYAGYDTVTGAAYNVNIGEQAGYYTEAGDFNITIGYRAGYGVNAQSHSRNIFIGGQSGRLITIGNDNVCIGHQAGEELTTGTGNIIIGYMAAEGQLTIENNVLWIANSNTATPLIYGTFPNTLFRLQATNFNVIGTSNLGDGGVTNYAETKTDGEINLHGTARVLKHLHFNNAAFTKGSTAPTQVILGNYNGWSFDIGDDSVIIATLPDDWDPTTDITIKICWYIDEAYAVDKEIQWRVDWSAAPEDFTEAIDAPTHSGQIDSGDIDIPAVAKRSGESTIGTIAAASLSALDCLGFTLSRIAVTNDNPTADPVVLHLTIEYTSNKLGIAT